MTSNFKLVSNWVTVKNKGSDFQLEPHDYKECVRNLIHATHPASLNYPSQIPSIFLCGMEDHKRLNKSPRWIVRDGLLPLLWFFETFPTPFKSLNTQLCLDLSLLETVPKAWRKFVLGRELFSIRKKLQPEKLLYTGMLAPQYVSIEGVSRTIGEVSKFLSKKRIDPLDVEVFCPHKLLDYNYPDIDLYMFNFAGQFISQYGKKLKLVDIAALRNQFNFSNYFVADLNSKFLLSDSCSMHHVLSLGASLTTAPSNTRAGEAVYLSPFHGWIISKKFPSSISKLNMSPERLGIKTFQEYFA